MSLSRHLLDQISERFLSPLPGEEAHLIMAPYQRKSAQEVKDNHENVREAATIMLIYPKKEEWYFALMLRPNYDGVHGGQVSFPGGKLEQGETSTEAALRELEEEIGVDGNRVDILGKLSDVYIPPSNMLVYPYVGVIDFEPIFYPDPTEVESVLEVPLKEIFDDRIVKQKKIEVGKYTDQPFFIEVPYFEFAFETVWGATALMISEFKEMLKHQITF